MKDYPENQTFLPADFKPVDVAEELERSNADVLINYMPVGSQKATEFYAKAALGGRMRVHQLHAGVHRVGQGLGEKFAKKNLPCIGDDIKSQIGATIVHRTADAFVLRNGA